MEPPRRPFKLLLTGEFGVGKSSLMMRFADGTYTEGGTRGVDFKIRTITEDGEKLALQVFDTAGQELHGAVPKSYYLGAHGIIVVYDVTSRESFSKVKHWVKESEELAQGGANKLLVGNKSDLTSERAVTSDEGKELADSLHMQFFETSAKDSDNVEQAFQTMARDIKQRVASMPQAKPGHTLGPSQPERSCGRC